LQELTVAHGEIERLKAEAAVNVEIKEELAQQRTTAASLVQELAAARGQIEQVKADSDAEGTQQHGSVGSLMHELAASRHEIARLKDEAAAAAERARAWRARFVAELQRK